LLSARAGRVSDVGGRSALKRLVLPKLGARQIGDITRTDIIRLQRPQASDHLASAESSCGDPFQ
jgi:hypothetical protein